MLEVEHLVGVGIERDKLVGEKMIGEDVKGVAEEVVEFKRVRV